MGTPFASSALARWATPASGRLGRIGERRPPRGRPPPRGYSRPRGHGGARGPSPRMRLQSPHRRRPTRRPRQEGGVLPRRYAKSAALPPAAVRWTPVVPQGALWDWPRVFRATPYQAMSNVKVVVASQHRARPARPGRSPLFSVDRSAQSRLSVPGSGSAVRFLLPPARGTRQFLAQVGRDPSSAPPTAQDYSS